MINMATIRNNECQFQIETRYFVILNTVVLSNFQIKRTSLSVGNQNWLFTVPFRKNSIL